MSELRPTDDMRAVRLRGGPFDGTIIRRPEGDRERIEVKVPVSDTHFNELSADTPMQVSGWYVYVTAYVAVWQEL